MFDKSNLLKANEFYNSLIRYPDRYYDETCNFLSGYFSLTKIQKEDVKRLLEFIDIMKSNKASHSSLYVLQCYLFDELNYSFKNQNGNK